MAIQQFGESLLSDIRKRNKQEAKRLRKEEEKQAIIGLGVGLLGKIGNEYLANKTENFLKNEQIFNSNIQQKSAAKNSADILNIYNTIQKSNMTEEEYFAQQSAAQVEARVKQQYGIEDIGTYGVYRDIVTKLTKEAGKNQAQAFQNAYGAAQRVADTDDFEAMVEVNTKKARPSNLASYTTRSLFNFFTGKSQQDLDEQAIEAITEGSMANNAEQFNVFMEEFNRTKNLESSYDFAKLVVPDEEEDKKFTVQQVVQLEELGDEIYEMTTTKKTDRYNPNNFTTDVEYKKVGNEVGGEDTTFDASAMKTFNTVFNYGKDGRDELTTEAFKNFAREAKELGIRPEAPLTMKEYRTLGKIYAGYTDDELNLRDDFRQDQILNVQEVLMSDAQDIQSIIAGLEETPEKRQELFNILRQQLLQLMRMSEESVTGRVNFVELQSGNR